MAKIYLIGGLPCSGKTTLAYNLIDLVIDDIFSLDQLPDTDDSFSITDVNFCNNKILSQCKEYISKKYPHHEVVEYFFENSVDKCIKNMHYRNDGRKVEQAIRTYSKFYLPPDDALPIWQPEEKYNESTFTISIAKR